MKRLIYIIPIVIPLLLNAQQNDSLDVGVKFTIQSIFDLALIEKYDYHPTNPGNVTPSPDDTVDYGTRTPGVYIVGSTSGTYALKLEVSSNIGQTWYLKTKGTGNFQSGNYNISLSNLSWALDGDPSQQTWTPYTTSYVQIASGGNTQTSYNLDLRLNIPWQAAATANYRTKIRFLLTTTP